MTWVCVLQMQSALANLFLDQKSCFLKALSSIASQQEGGGFDPWLVNMKLIAL